MASVHTHRNRLSSEKSPYLLQHAHNPVDWYPWGEEAFARAEREDRPVFLSIGYSACHWCHVMERESFEHEEVAALLNAHFVSVKVDREERPDVDQIYMELCQALTGSGGWPLTVLMTPDKKPFFAGTYFPRAASRGMPGLTDLLRQVAQLWKNRRSEMVEAGDRLVESIREQALSDATAQKTGIARAGALEPEMVRRCFDLLRDTFDPVWGGFGSAPKFPAPHNLAFLLRYWRQTGESAALDMVETTLQAMHDGGIYDHLGGGFARYSTDRKWLVPHFEKMLYDNALLSMVYCEAYQATGRTEYLDVARETLDYVLRDMTSQDGAFYSSQDADSEGEEGKFYVWTPDEIEQALGKELGGRISERYRVTARGIFEGKSILNRLGWRTEVPRQAGSPGATAQNPEGHGAHQDAKVGEARLRLLEARSARTPPARDDKVLTSWNGLMIAAFAAGSRVTGEAKYLRAARNALAFMLARLRRPDGRLLARYRDGEAAYPGYLDDYAFLIWALLETYDVGYDPGHLELALSLQADLDRLFWDDSGGGYFFYGSDAEQLLTRPKPVDDGAMPSGNSVAALNLLRMGRLLWKQEYVDRARRLLSAFAAPVGRYPAGHTQFLTALLLDQERSRDVVVSSPLPSDPLREVLRPIQGVFAPETLFLYAPADQASRLTTVAPFVSGMPSRDGQTTFYVCRDFTCEKPTTDLGSMARSLSGPLSMNSENVRLSDRAKMSPHKYL